MGLLIHYASQICKVHTCTNDAGLISSIIGKQKYCLASILGSASKFPKASVKRNFLILRICTLLKEQVFNKEPLMSKKK